MNFQEQSDALSNYVRTLPAGQMADPPLWQLERDGEAGFFLNEPGITLADVADFLTAVLGSRELLHALAPDLSGADVAAALPLPLENVHLSWLTLTEMADGDGHELKLLLDWEMHTASVTLLDDPHINPHITFSLESITARIALRR